LVRDCLVGEVVLAGLRVMKKASLYGLYVLLGVVSYGATNLLIQWIVPQGLLWIVLLPVFVPATVSLVYLLLSRRHPHSQYPLGLPLFMVLGIWLFGPLAITLDPGFSLPVPLGDFLFMWAFFPWTTFVWAIYTGSLSGLLITSFLLPLYSMVAKTRCRTSSGSQPPPATDHPDLAFWILVPK